MIALLLYGAPPKIFDRAIAAHLAMRHFRAHIQLDASINTKPRHTIYDLNTDGKTAVIRIREPKMAGKDKSDRTFYIGLKKMVAYDAYANQRLERDFVDPGNLLQRVTDVIGAPDDMLKDLIDPAAMKEFFGTMKGISGWTTKPSKGQTMATRQERGAKSVLAFDASGSRLRGVSVKAPNGDVNWKFDYSPGVAVAFAPPRSAELVTSFLVAPEPPHYKNAAAERVVSKMLKAYRALTRGTIDVQSEEGVTRIQMDGRKFRETQVGLTWAYDGKSLAVSIPKRQTLFQGTALRSTVPDLVAELGGRVDPISRQFLQRRVPFQEVLQPQMMVSLAGQMQANGISCEILKLELPNTLISMFVRADNHLVQSVTTQILDAKGRPTASSLRQFNYEGIGKPIPDSVFMLKVGAGQKMGPLPELKLQLPRK